MSDALTADERQRIERAVHPAYRPGIDGLRAIAVVSVILYHAGVRGFSGGFVGVDIFFVISGYLITGILARDVTAGRHTITEFYRRRILRIFPALMAMLLATSVASALLLLPAEIRDYSWSLAGTGLFASNIVFYSGTDYFNLGATSQPLLHTWSLAVEEQWYLLWPLILTAIGPSRPRIGLATTLLISAVSLVIAVWGLPRDPAATFYLLPARAWELGLGAALALARPRLPGRWVAEALALAGIALILASVKFYTKDTSFPGLAALPPCLGALALLYIDRVPTLVGLVLGWAPLRLTGLISYSLYLWHWPVLVLAETGLFLPRGVTTTILLLALILLLSVLSWRFVERPFRHGVAGWPTSRVLGGGALAIVATLALALVVPAANRVLAPLTPQQAGIARYLTLDPDAAYRRGTCFKVGARESYPAAICLAASGHRPAVLFVGDSHAAQLWPGLARHRDQFDILQATATGCMPKLYPAGVSGCGAVINDALRGYVAGHRPALTILAAKWQMRWLDGLEASLRDPALRAAHPILLGPLPRYGVGLPRLLVAADRGRDPDLLIRSLDPEPFALDPVLAGIAARTGTPYISLIDLLCRGQRCRTLAAPGVPMQFDDSHLTPEGSAIVVDAILRKVGLPPR
jgi:peptidoglycan/LPS O-acetylase OafA/YrhL